MKTRFVRNLCIVSALLFVLLANTTCISAEPVKKPQPNSLLFTYRFVINIHWDENATQTPIQPRDTRHIPIMVSSRVLSDSLGRLFLRLYAGRQYIIHMKVIDTPTWCSASLALENLPMVIYPNQMQAATTQLTLRISDDAPANITLAHVTLRASVDDFKGFFNIRTIIQKYDVAESIFFITGT